MVKTSTIRTNFICEKQRFSSRKTEIFWGQFHAPAAKYFSAVGIWYGEPSEPFIIES